MFSVDTSEPDTVRPRIAPLSSLPTLPEGWSGVNYVGEIKLDAPGRTLYVSNRGHDSVAVFSVDATSGTVARVSVDPTGGRTPRHFGLSPCGRFAVVGDQDSDVVRVFTRCPDTGRLTLLPAADLALPSPCFVLFQRPHGLVPAHMPATPAVRASSGALDTAALVAGHEWEQLEVLSSPTAVVACS
jgi:6-phosphogluconolactonase (cycloisomerase 2 family)